MVKTTYIGSVVVNEVAYKYSLTPPAILAEGEEQTEAVFNSLDELKKELPEALKQIEYINPALFPCCLLIEADDEHGKEEEIINGE